MDVRVGPQATRLILGEHREAIDEKLGDLDAEVPLWNAGRLVLERAAELWPCSTIFPA